MDGSGNNKKNPSSGKASAEMPRITKAAYLDTRSAMQTKRRNPRELSNIIGSIAEGEKVELNEYGLNMLFVMFGQFINHDVNLVAGGKSEKISIPIPEDDPLFDKQRKVDNTITFFRSKTKSNITNLRNFENEVTSFIDGSQIYGSN